MMNGSQHDVRTSCLDLQAGGSSDILARRRERLAGLTRGGQWYSIRNAAGPVAEVRIYDVIGFFGVTAEDFANEIADITAPEIVVGINSPGGDVFDGIAIFNSLRVHPARVTTRVDGLAASAASVIVQAGDERVMLTASQMMIHAAWGIVIGTAGDMREFADLLDRQTDVLAGIYASRAGVDPAHFRAILRRGDTWYSDHEAVEAGLADQVVDPAPDDVEAKWAPSERRRALLDALT